MYKQEAESPRSPFYEPFKLSLFAEETILNPGNSNNVMEFSPKALQAALPSLIFPAILPSANCP